MNKKKMNEFFVNIKIFIYYFLTQIISLHVNYYFRFSSVIVK